ncbi:MAG: alpha/beta hydrolase, partial [Promethearchaeota archaeon]
MRNNFENEPRGEGINNNLKPKANWNKIDHLIQNIIKGKRKKYIVLFLSLVSMIIVCVGFIPMTRIITNAGSPDNNGIGISTVSFDLTPDQNPYGISEHIVGELYRAHNSIGDTLNMSMMNSTYKNGSAPGIVVLHGFGWGTGKEEMTSYCVELSKRGFIVLAIDLAQQGYTSGSKPAIFPHAEFDPYIVNASINFLKALPYVNASSIGLLGYSFGGASAAISAGVLGNTINATVIMNGFTNVTDWLLRGILPSMNITYHISGNELVFDTIKSADNPSGQQISVGDMNDLVRAFNFIRGRSEFAERIIIKDTTALNLTELSKMNAVNYLNNAAPNSLMFIHGIYDNTFDFTNQSEQGYNASINGAIYVPLNDKHYLIYNNDSLWATINFFKTRLLGYNISNSYTGAKHFLVATDNLGLNAFNLFDESLKIKELLIMLGALLPIVLNIYVIMYTKRFETERAEKVIEKENQITAFSGARFSKQIFGIIGMLASSFLILFIIGKGLDNPTLLYTLAGIFYVSMYFA